MNRLKQFVLATITSAISSLAIADPVRVVIPFPPGGATDQVWQVLKPHLEKAKFHSIIEYKPGSEGRLGTAYLSTLPGDGKAIGILPLGTLIYSEFYDDAFKFDLNSFRYITYASSAYYALATSSPRVSSLEEFKKIVETDPSSVQVASGSASHRFGMLTLLNKMGVAGVTIIPYKGAAQAVNDVMGGHVEFIYTTLNTVLPHHQAGKLRILGISSTVPHQGFEPLSKIAKDFEHADGMVVVVPKTTSWDYVRTYETIFLDVLNLESVNNGLRAIQRNPTPGYQSVDTLKMLQDKQKAVEFLRKR